MGKFRFGRNSNKNMKGVKNELVILARRVLEKSPYDFGIPRDGGFRTVEDQKRLFKTIGSNGKRVTNLDGVEKISYHQTGWALDIFLYHYHVKGGRKRACWSCIEKYKEVAHLFKVEFLEMKNEGFFSDDVELIWGGDWKSFKDLPHFQISKIKE